MIVEFDASKAMLVKPFIAVRDIRYYLGGINVRPCIQGGVMLAATDGHRLVAVYDPSGSAEREIIVRFEVPRTAAKAPARAVLEGERLVIRTKKQENFVQPGKAEIDGKFPDWLKIVPDISKLEPGLPGGYNAKYLGDLLELADGPGDFVQFYRQPAIDAAVVCRYSNQPELIAILMPARITVSDSPAPDWLQKMMPPKLAEAA